MASPIPIPNIFDRLRRLIPIGDGWVLVVSRESGFSPGPTGVSSFAEFKGALYATVDHLAGLRIWRSSTGKSWQELVGPKGNKPAGFGVMNRGSATGMAVLDGTLYVATKVGVWMTDDGTSWRQPNESTMKTHAIDAVKTFGSHVYVTTGTQIWRSTTTGWEPVVADKAPAKIKQGFGDSDITDVTHLEVFDGWLYAGAGLDNPLGSTGIAVWRTNNGTDWVEFKKETSKPGPLHTYAMASFDGDLYVGGYHVLRVYRTDGSTKSWVDVTNGINTGGGNDGASAITVFRKTLYLGATGIAAGKMLWKSPDGATWNQADTKLIGTDKFRVHALGSHNKHLYLSPQYKRLEIWRYGPRYLPEDAFVHAKPFLARMPRFWVPPPPVIFVAVAALVGTAIFKLRELLRRG